MYTKKSHLHAGSRLPVHTRRLSNSFTRSENTSHPKTHEVANKYIFSDRELCEKTENTLSSLQQKAYRIPCYVTDEFVRPKHELDKSTFHNMLITNARFARIPIDQWFLHHRSSNLYGQAPCAVGYDQILYTAGDWSDMWYHAVYHSYIRMRTPKASHQVQKGPLRPRVQMVMEHIQKRYIEPSDSPYVKLSPATTVHTLRYMFQKLQKGIYVRIKDNRLEAFLPFVRHNFTNDYYERLFEKGRRGRSGLKHKIPNKYVSEHEDVHDLLQLQELESSLRRWDEWMDCNDPEDESVFPVAVRNAYRSTLEQFLRLEYKCARRYADNHPPNPKIPFDDVNKEPNRRKWLANNHFFNTAVYLDNPHVIHYHHLFHTLVAHRKHLPDFEAILQPRDYPVLNASYDPSTTTTTIFQPYPDVTTQHNHVQMVCPGGLSPILSHSGKDGYYDVPLPTVDDIEHFDQKIFVGRCRTPYVNSNNPKSPAANAMDERVLWVNWKDKPYPKAVFRGSGTGKGTNECTNMRMKVQHISHNYQSPNNPHHTGYRDLFDVHLVSLNNRKPKIDTATTTFPDNSDKEEHGHRGGLVFVDSDAIQKEIGPVGKQFYLDRSERVKYKYVLCLDGHTRADRFGSDLCTGSLVILPTTDGHRLWLEPFLTPLSWEKDIYPFVFDKSTGESNGRKPLTPYIIQQKGYTHVTIQDMNGLEDLVAWLVDHDDIGEAIVANTQKWLFGNNIHRCCDYDNGNGNDNRGAVAFAEKSYSVPTPGLQCRGHYLRQSPATSFMYDYMEGVMRAFSTQFSHSTINPFTLVTVSPSKSNIPTPSKSKSKSKSIIHPYVPVAGIVVGFRDTEENGVRSKQLAAFCAYFDQLFPSQSVWRKDIIVVEQVSASSEKKEFAAWWNSTFGASTEHITVKQYATELERQYNNDRGALPACVTRNIALVKGDVKLAVGVDTTSNSVKMQARCSQKWSLRECYRWTGEQKFNLGALKNVGFDHLRRRHGSALSHVVFTDIDMLPDHELANHYVRVPKPNEIIALAHRGTVYDRFRIDDMPTYLLTGQVGHRTRCPSQPSCSNYSKVPGSSSNKTLTQCPRHLLQRYSQQNRSKVLRTTRGKQNTTSHRVGGRPGSRWKNVSKHRIRNITHKRSSPIGKKNNQAPTTTFRPITVEGKPCVSQWASDKRKFSRFVGAAVSFSPALFESVNGYPNSFWGWGGEDDELNQRLRRLPSSAASKPPFLYTVPPEGRLIDLEMAHPVTFADKMGARVKEMQKYERLRTSVHTWRKDGVMQIGTCVGETLSEKQDIRLGPDVWRIRVRLND